MINSESQEIYASETENVMGKLILKSFEQLGIERKQALDCFDMPIAYGTTAYADDNYFSYFLLTLMDHCWNDSQNLSMQSQKRALNYLGLDFVLNYANTKNEFLQKTYASIDNGNPVFITLDYFNIFYEPTFYHRQHIPHGTIITGYEEDRGRLVLQENAHMDFVGMYQLYLTDDMVYDMWKKSSIYFNQGDESAQGILYSIAKTDRDSAPKTLLDVFEFFISEISKRKNSLISILTNNQFSYLSNITNQTSFRKHQYISMEVLFDIIQLLISRSNSDDTVRECTELREEYLCLRNILVLNIIKNAITSSEFSSEIADKYINSTQDLDCKLINFSKKLISQINSSKNKKHIFDLALNCKVTASSETEYAGLPAIAANTVNGNIGSELAGNVWCSNATDSFHWLLFDLEAIAKIQKIVLRFERNYCLKYDIEASCDGVSWETVVMETDNSSEIVCYNVHDIVCRYLKLKIDIPVLYGSAAMLREFEAWGVKNNE